MKTPNIKNHLLKGLISLILIASILAACKKDEVDPQKNFIYFSESQLIATVSKASVLSVASFYPDVYAIIATKELSDVGVFKIKYKTTNVDGVEIIASGAVLVPITDNPMPLVSYQHGTLTSASEAPSMFFNSGETKGLATILASTGYAVSVPDYLGYGESADYPHPYEHSKTLASASFDMLMAAKEFFANNDIYLTDKLFLTGYSEGGNATMALHQYIEQHSDLVVTMSAPAAGAYNKTAFAKEIVQRNENLTFLPQFMWVIQSYNWIYKLNRTWGAYVNEPYAATLAAVSNPFNLGDADISHNPQELFTSQLINNVMDGTDTDFMNALADNNTFDWAPKSPVTLYYGTADDYVFPLNSQTAYDALIANGATVTKVAFDGADHSTATIPYALAVFELFESMK